MACGGAPVRRYIAMAVATATIVGATPADGAWVVWMRAFTPGASERLSPLGAKETLEACEQEAEMRAIKALDTWPETRNSARMTSPTTVALTNPDGRPWRVGFVCLPESIDPRH